MVSVSMYERGKEKAFSGLRKGNLNVTECIVFLSNLHIDIHRSLWKQKREDIWGKWADSHPHSLDWSLEGDFCNLFFYAVGLGNAGLDRRNWSNSTIVLWSMLAPNSGILSHSAGDTTLKINPATGIWDVQPRALLRFWTTTPKVLCIAYILSF